MAGAGQRKGKKDDNGIGTAIDFVLSNARLVLGVGGAAMLGIATLAVKRVSACSPSQGWEREAALQQSWSGQAGALLLESNWVRGYETLGECS